MCFPLLHQNAHGKPDMKVKIPRLLNIINFSMFPCSQFSSEQKAECHVQESSGKHGQAGFGSGETETDEFGFKEPPERKENPSARPECFEQPGEARAGSEFCFMERQATDAKQQPRPNSIFSRAATR